MPYPRLRPADEDLPPSSRAFPAPREGEQRSQETRVFQVRLSPPPGHTARGAGDTTVSFLDRSQLEIRLHYAINDARERNRYRVEAYFFVPSALGLTAQTYGRADFYRDMLTYFSFGVPRVPVSAIAAGREPGALVRRALKLLAEARERPDPPRVERASWELRLLGCMVGGHMEEGARALGVEIKALRGRSGAAPTAAAADLRARARALLADARAMMLQVRDLSPHVRDPALPAPLREVYRWVDEHLSLTLESEWTRLVDYLDRDPEATAELGDIRGALVDGISAEQRLRAIAGYRSLLGPDDAQGAEYFNYRAGVLKKFVRSVLYLELARGEEGRKIAELAASIAAGTAMLVSTVIATVSHEAYGLNTTPFVLILVVTYILKDRIKDWLKRFVVLKASRWSADYSVHIQDKRSAEILGRCREVFSFVPAAKLPREVLACRHEDPGNIIEIESKPESVMRYEKQVRLYARRIRALYREVEAVHDVIRLDMTDLLQRADGSERRIRLYRPEADGVEIIRCTNTYHLNVVLLRRSEEDREATIVGRVRVVLDKEGIKRVESA